MLNRVDHLLLQSWRELLCVGACMLCCAFIANSAIAVDSQADWPWVDTADQPAVPGSLQVQFLGTAGVLMQYQDDGVITDPFFTNPSLSDLLLLRDLRTDKTNLLKYLPNLSKVDGLLIGHGHYDHLMDVATVASLLPTHAKVYGSASSIHQIAAQLPKNKAVNVLPFMVSHGVQLEPGNHWISLTDRLRVMIIEAGHSAHLAGYTFANDRVTEPMSELPGSVMSWQCGQALGYVLEWLEKDSVKFRALYMSSAAGFPLGVPPASFLAQHKSFDVVLLPVAKFRSVQNYPDGLLQQISARHVVLIHWEKFWRPYVPGQEMAVSNEEVTEFIARVKTVAPEATLHLPRRLQSIWLEEVP